LFLANPYIKEYERIPRTKGNEDYQGASDDDPQADAYADGLYLLAA
jgi:hypothetical protein